MSEPEAETVLSPSGESENSSSSPTTEEAQETEEMHLAQLDPSQTPTKKYNPPKADASTFPSQKAFLESLQLIPIDDVERDNRKCPICWKPFGEEPDPGFDNSELPVRLRCNHVFGHKCLANIFGIAAPSRISLEPLSFEKCKKGLLLAVKLHAYYSKHGPNFRNDLETFEKMLQNSNWPGQGDEIFGPYWWPVLQEINMQHTGRNTANVTFMENAVVLDYNLAEQKEHTTSPYTIPPQFLSSTSTDMDQTLVSLVDASGTSSTWASHHNHITTLSDDSSVPSIAPPLLDVTSDTTLAVTIPSPIPPTTYDPYPMASKSAQSGSDAMKTWQAALANETNLDKLSALHKQKEDRDETTTDLSVTQKQEALDAQAAQEVARKLVIHRMEGHERKIRDLRTLVAQKLVDVYTRYQAAQLLASTERTSENSPRIIQTPVCVHSYQLNKTTYAIAPPTGGPVHSEEEASDQDEDNSIDIASSTLFIMRSFCNTCCASAGNQLPTTLLTPTELTWHNHKSIPDSCPLCHRILFKKTANN